jgi:MFS family permease
VTAAPRQVRAAAFASSIDRFIAPPLLVSMAAGFGVSLAAATLVASAHYLLYGLMQPFWALASDRLGRVAVIRITLAGAAVAGLLAAAAPTLATAIVLRALTGAFIGGLVPATIVYVGETVPFAERSRALEGLVGMTTLGTAVATTVSGGLAQVGAWRVALALPALLAGALVVRLRLAEPAGRQRESGARAALAVARLPWAWVVVALALVEGALVVGTLTFFAPALERAGAGPAVAGLAVAAYGLSAWAWTAILRRRRVALRHPSRLAAGGLLIAGGLGCCAAFTGAGVAAGAVLVGAGFATAHPILQAWATDVAPAARATMIALFASALFVGGSVSSVLAAGLADAGRFGRLFGTAAVAAVGFAVVAAVARSRYAPSDDAASP